MSSSTGRALRQPSRTSTTILNENDDDDFMDIDFMNGSHLQQIATVVSRNNGSDHYGSVTSPNNNNGSSHSSGSSSSISSSQHHHRPRHGSNSQPPLHPHHRSHNRSHHRTHHRVHQNLSRNGSSSGSSSSRSTSPLNRIVSDAGGGGPGYHLAHNCAYSQPLSPTNITCGSPNCENQSPKLLPSYEQTHFQCHSPPAVVNGFGSYSSASSSITPSTSPNCLYDYDNSNNRPPSSSTDCDQVHHLHHHQSPHLHNHNHHQHGLSSTCSSASSSFNSKSSSGFSSSANGASASTITNGASHGYGPTNGSYVINGHGRAKANGSYTSTGQLVHHRPTCPQHPSNMHQPNCPLAPASKPSAPSDMDYLSINPSNPVKPESDMITIAPPPPALLEASAQKKKPQPRHELIEFSFLLPNGCFLTLVVYDDATLKDVKHELWIKYKAMVKELQQPAEPPADEKTATPGSKVASRLRALRSRAFGSKNSDSTNNSSTTSPTTNTNNTVVTSIARQSLSELFASSMPPSQTMPAINNNNNNNRNSAPVGAVVHLDEPKKQKSKRRLSFSFKKRSPSLNLGKFNFWGGSSGGSSGSSAGDGGGISLEKRSGETAKIISPTTSPDLGYETLTSITSPTITTPLARSMSVRKRMIQSLFPKWNKTDSMRSTSVSIPVTSNVKVTNVVPDSSAHSTPTSPVGYVPSLTYPTSLQLTSPFDSNNNNPNQVPIIEEAEPLKPPNSLLLTTTASMVLPDFGDGHDAFSRAVPPSAGRLAALANEDSSDYVFAGITLEGKMEEFYDDTVKLFDLNLFMPVLRLVEAIGNKKEKLLNHIVSSIIGKPLNELDSIRTDEFRQYRHRMHSTMLETVQEREELSIDERLFYEFPPELDDIDTLTLSTKRVTENLDEFESFFCEDETPDNSSSRETLVSFPSYESLNVNGGGAAGGSPGMRTTKSESDTLTTTGTGISRNSSNDRLIKLPNIAPNGSEEDKPVYTEVVALKRSRFFHSFKKSEHVPPTEYPMLLLADSSCNSNRNRNRKKNSDSVDAAPHLGPGPRAKMAILIRPEDEEIDENIVVIKSGRNNGSRQAKPTTKKIVKSDSNLTDDLKEQAAVAANSSDTAEPAMSSSLQSLTKKMQESQQLHPKGENTDYGDHYELCFDRRQDINSLQPPRPVRIAFNIWTSLATVMHGASNGDISNCGDLSPLLQLFDEMTNAENAAKEALKAAAAAKKLSDSQAAKTNGKNGKTKSSHPSTPGGKPPSEPRKKSKSATSKLFGRLFRSPKPSSLNVIKEGVSQDAQQQKKSKAKQPTLMSTPIESPISPSLSSSSSSSSQVITTTNNKATTISGKLQFEDPTQSPSPTLPHTTNQDTNTLVISPSAAATQLTEDNANASSGDSGSEIDPTGMPQDGTSLATTSPTIDLSVQLSPSQPIFAAVQSITTSPMQSGALVPIGSSSLTSQRTTIFESRPHLLPQLYQVKCQPEGTVPRELAQRLLRQYCIWLRARLQGMLTQLQQKAAAAHQQLHSAPSSSSSSSGGVHTSATASLSKTITKFLSPKSPSSSSTTSSSSGTKSPETDTSAYVEMNYSPSSDNSSTSPGTTTTTTTTNTSPSSPSTEHTSQLGSTVTLQTTTDLASLSTSSNTSPSSLSSTPTSPATPTTPDSLNSPFAEEIAKVKHLLERLEHNKLYLNPDRYLMKICGYEQYLLGDYSLMMFDYIRNCVSKGKTPQLMLISKLAIVEKIPSYLYVQPYFLRRLSMQYHHHPPFNSSNILLSSSGGFHLSKFATQAREKLLLMANDESGKLATNKSSDHRGRLNQRRASLQAPTQLSLTVSTTQLSSSVDKDSHLATAVANENHTSSQTSSAVADSDTNYAVICANQTMRQKHHHRKRKESIDSSMTSSVDSTLDTSADTLDLEASTLCLASKTSSSSIAEKCSTAKSDKQQTAVERSQKLKEKSNLKKNISFDSSLDSAKTTPKDDTEDDDDNSLDSWIDHGIVHKNLISLWKISTVFRVRVLLATYVNVKDVDRIYVQAGIYHGSESLCQHQCTKQVEPQNPRWDQMLEFPELCFLDLPLSSRLSIALCAVVNRRKPHEEFATAWINLQLFNYKRCLLSGRISLNLWPMPNGFEGFLNPFGHSGTNPNRYQAPRIQIEFDTFPRPVVYPPRSAILEYANVVSKQEEQFIQQLEDMDSRNEELPNMIETRMLVQYPKLECLSFFENCSINRFFRCKTSFRWIVKQLRKLTSRLDPFAALSEQEKDFFWRERETVMKACPDALPKVLESVRWSCREEVCQMYELLSKWPTVSVDTSIILLGGRYIDTMIREFAIHSLDVGLTDGLMVHYLLQLIQLLKNEPHHDNALARLLLRRALLNRRFGHLFFWNLRSQINDSICTARWCVLLEMYCRGLSQTALRTTLQQVEALDEIERISNETINEADRREAIMKQFTLSNVLVKVSKFYNPLNITIPLDQLMHEKCRVMDSAKRPLWLEWTNSDPFAKHNGLNASAVIFKTGDDLRQDMLTLQVIRIMDLIWRRQNLDLKMLPYNCLATGNQVGLIEVVSHAQTVMGIQRCGGRMAALQVDNSKLHKWIKDHNLHNYEHAVDNFTRSCAGYCVATFILGIGDRNPDNIMVNEDGQIFHIDFGHFLGHFKKKFGINRERVPFVLTYDFLQVITKGADDPLKSKEFEAFQRLCYDAYLALHDNAQLLISLFIMMLGTGIPELQTLEDVQYLRQTLQVDKTREEALQYFETQLDEAHGGAWSTKLDWFFHSVKHA